jgi:mannose-6-phosphate isomerase-like protein (cupin superfamily)
MKVWWLLNKGNAPLATFSELHWVVFPAGQCHGLHRHADMEETYVVLRGRGLHLTTKGPVAIGPGDAIHIPAGEWHGIEVSEETEVIVFCAREGGMAHYSDAAYEEHPELYHDGPHPNRAGGEPAPAAR